MNKDIPFSGCISLFIHSPTEHLGGFQVLKIMSKVVINVLCRIFSSDKFSTPLGKYQGAQLLDCMV